MRPALVACVLLSACSARAADKPEYAIRRTASPIVVDGKFDEPAWFAAPSVGPFEFAWHASGEKEQTVAKMLWDDEYLYVAYVCQDAHIWAEHTKRDSSVWLDDAVEVFTAPNPERPNEYYNVEMSVSGASLDHFHPKGVGPKPESGWNPELKIATTVQGSLNDDGDADSYWTLEVAIPFAAYEKSAKSTPPKPGDVWNLNLNRLGGKTNEQFSQWSRGTGPEPAFHRPQDFGRVTFSEERVPF